MVKRPLISALIWANIMAELISANRNLSSFLWKDNPQNQWLPWAVLLPFLCKPQPAQTPDSIRSRLNHIWRILAKNLKPGFCIYDNARICRASLCFTFKFLTNEKKNSSSYSSQAITWLQASQSHQCCWGQVPVRATCLMPIFTGRLENSLLQHWTVLPTKSHKVFGSPKW